MKKHLVVIGIIFVLLMVGFSGCTELNGNVESSGEIEKVELVSYKVETQKWDYGYKTIGNGFNYSKDAELYLITGTVKNIAGETIISVNITAKFYDSTNIFLKEKTTYLGGIPNTRTEDFGIYYFANEKYFENIRVVKFEFEVR